MPDTPEMIRQRAYRKRRTAKLERQTNALNEIIEALKGNGKPLAEKVRAIAWGGLHGEEG